MGPDFRNNVVYLAGGRFKRWAIAIVACTHCDWVLAMVPIEDPMFTFYDVESANTIFHRWESLVNGWQLFYGMIFWAVYTLSPAQARLA